MHNIYTLHCMLTYTVPNACHISAAILLMQGWIQELARGGAKTGQVIGGRGEPDSLVSCCIFEAANNHFLVVSHC